MSTTIFAPPPKAPIRQLLGAKKSRFWDKWLQKCIFVPKVPGCTRSSSLHPLFMPTYSCRSHSCRLIHARPIHAWYDRFMPVPIHALDCSCPTWLIHARIDSCQHQSDSCPYWFMPRRPIHARSFSCQTFSCPLDLFMPVPIHAKAIFKSKESLTLANLIKPYLRSLAPNPAGASTHPFIKICWLVLCVPELS